MQLYDDEGNSLPNSFITSGYPASEDWELMSVEQTVSSQTVAICFGLQTEGSKVQAWIDDVSFEKIPQK
jgi:hypothetical protein